MTSRRLSVQGQFAWFLILVLAVAHYDFWLWDDRSVVFDFVPVGLWYQVLISVGAAIGWAFVVKFAWPTHIEEWAEGGEEAGDE